MKARIKPDPKSAQLNRQDKLGTMVNHTLTF